MTHVEIRDATEEDLPAVLRILAESGIDGGESFTLEEARQHFARIRQRPGFRLLVAVTGGEIAGTYALLIMLAVVTERTHEIGIRKSVGARKRDILNQFLVESAVLSASGGVIGVMIAWIVAVLVRSFTPVPMSVPVTAVIVGVTLSAVVGLFFGIYPAQRAAQLDPIEALRAEK